MRLLLYIDNDWKQPEMSDDENNGIALTYTYDSLINPIDYVSEYSLTFKLPKTESNNRMFDEFRYLDSTIGHFKPYALFNYQLISDVNDIISSGTCYLNTIDDEYYNLNLSGSLSFIFKSLLNCGWDSEKALTDNTYTLLPEYINWDGNGYNNKVKLSKSLVYDSWINDNPTFDWQTLKERMNESVEGSRVMSAEQFATNIIGFSPSFQGQYKDFNSDKWLRKKLDDANVHIATLFDIFNNTELPTDGVIDRQMCEYRSYYQTPYIYMSKLWQWFQDECYNITGYEMDLDLDWFNVENPYFSKLVYMLPSLYNDNDAKVFYSNQNNIPDVSYEMPKYETFDRDLKSVGMSAVRVRHTSNKFTNTDNIVDYKLQFNLKYSANSGDIFWQSAMGSNAYVMYNVNNPLYVTLRLTNGTTTYATKKYLVYPCSTLKNNQGEYVYKPNEDIVSMTSELADEVLEYYYDPKQFNSISNEVSFGEFQLNIKYNGVIDNAYVVADFRYINDYSPFRYYVPWQDYTYAFYPTISQDGRKVNVELCGGTERIENIESKRTYTDVTLEKLFKETSPFTVLLEYTKMFNIIWLLDDYNKAIKVMPRYTHFSKCMSSNLNVKTPAVGDVSYIGFADLTDLVDMTKGMTVQSPSWDNKIIEFNYDSTDEEYMKSYLEKYGRSYGGKLLLTENEKNANVKKLFANTDYDKIKPSCINSEWLIPVRNIILNNNVKVESKPLVSNSTGDVWNNFYFRNTNGDWNDGVNAGWRQDVDGSYVLITDDTLTEIDNDVYCWQTEGNGNYIKCYQRPRLNVATTDDAYSIWFAKPREIYHQFPYNDNMICVYDHCWKNFIEEIYNVNNKKVVCYIQIDSKMYRRLKMNPLVQIKNCIYLLTEVCNWSEQNEKSKCTLVQINDITKLSGDKYKKGAIVDNLLCFDNGDIVQFDNGDSIKI